MKRVLLLLMLFSFVSPCFASDMDFWDEPMKIDTDAKTQQKAVTDQEFEKVMSLFEKKKKKAQEKKKPKGNPNMQISPEMEQNSGEMGNLKNLYESYPTVMIPVDLITDSHTEIPVGYYRILSVKKDYGYYLNFYQGNSLIARIPAKDTGNDHNQKSLNYTKIIPVDDKYMNVIYGDIDCNLESKVYIKKTP